MTKIRIAHIISPTFGSSGFSGETHHEFSLISGWQDAEISMDLLGTQLKVINQNSGERIYKLSGNLWSQRRKTTKLDRFASTLKVLWLLVTRANKYDIFHFTTVNWGALLSPLILHPLGKKVVFKMLRYGSDNPSYIRGAPKGKFIVGLLRRFDGIICLAPAFFDDCKRHNFRNKLLILPNFMAIPQLEGGKDIKQGKAFRSQLRIPPDAQILLYVGVAHKRKGLDILVDSFITLSKKYPKLWLIIVGPRSINDNFHLDENFLPQQKLKIAQAGLENRVLWAGMISDLDELARYYRAADLFVLPTHSEGSPNVLAEAMYAELPVVISHLPGITDSIIRHREDGYLVKVDNTKGFVDSMDALVRDPCLRQSMGQNGRQRAVELFGFEQYCQKIKDFYIEIMG